MKYLIILAVIMAVIGCEQSGDGALTKDFDRSGSPQKITVFVYQSKSEMQNAKADFVGDNRERDLLGWSKWTNIKTTGCEIHVVKLRHKNHTARMKTWGHELAHCLYGAYHKEVS